MMTEAQLRQVQQAIEKEDPDREDEQLDSINDTLRFVLGDSGETPEEFISLYIASL